MLGSNIPKLAAIKVTTMPANLAAAVLDHFIATGNDGGAMALVTRDDFDPEAVGTELAKLHQQRLARRQAEKAEPCE